MHTEAQSSWLHLLFHTLSIGCIRRRGCLVTIAGNDLVKALVQSSVVQEGKWMEVVSEDFQCLGTREEELRLGLSSRHCGGKKESPGAGDSKPN